MSIPAPTNIDTGAITWRAAYDVVDSDDPGDDPDFRVPVGTATFVASVTKLLDPTALPVPLTVLRSPITGVLDDDGYLCTPNPDGTPGYRYVRLIACDDEDLNPNQWTYTVTYNLRDHNGVRLSLTSHPVVVLKGQTRDLTTAIPPDAANTVGVPQAEALAAQAASAATEALERAILAETSAEIAATTASRVNLPAYGVGEFSFDPGTSLYGGEFLMQKTRDKFRTAAAGGAVYKIAVLGDSLSSGYLTSQMHSWPALVARFHLPGRNVTVRGERVNLTALNGAVSDPRLEYAGPWDFTPQTSGVLSAPGSATVTFNTAGTVVEVKVQGNAANAYDIVIDGDTAIRVNVPGDFAEHVHTVSGLADTPHTVHTAYVSGSWSPASIFCGYEAGVDVYNTAVSGSSSDDWTGAPTYQVYPAVTWAPDLVIVPLLYNDFFSATSPEDYKANLLTTIGLFPTDTDFLLVGEYRSTTVAAANVEAYLTSLYELSNVGAIPLLDLAHAWRNSDTDLLTGVDDLHLNAAGTAAFARAVTGVLAGTVAGLSADAVTAKITAALPARQTLDDLVEPFHYLHGVGSTNGLPLDPTGTLAAVENAIAGHPSDLVMVDLDYRRTRDGVLVSAHDATTGGISDVNVTIGSTAFRDLPAVIKPALYGAGHERLPIASHEALLAAARGRAVFSIEVKDGLSAVPDAIALTHRLGMVDSIVWAAGDPTVVAALTSGGLRAFMFNCTTTTKLNQAAAAGAWMVDVPTDASTALVDHAMSLNFAHVIRGFVTTSGVAQATDAFTQLAGMDPRLSGAATDATGYLDRAGGATVRSADSIAGAIRTGKRGPGWRVVNSGNLTDWLTPGNLYLRKGAGGMVYTFGDLAGTPSATQTITAKFVYDVLPTTLTQSARLKLYSPTENPANASANTVEGYVLGLQADGLVFLNSVPVGGGSPSSVLLSNIAGLTLVAGTEYTVTIEIDDTTPGVNKIRVTRVDTGGTSGWVTEGTRAIWRGKYHSAHSSLTDGQVRISGLAIS